MPANNLANLKLFLARKKCSLKSLKLYDCDKEALEILARGSESKSLEELQILKFNQSQATSLVDLMPLSQLRLLERLTLCPTYHPL